MMLLIRGELIRQPVDTRRTCSYDSCSRFCCRPENIETSVRYHVNGFMGVCRALLDLYRSLMENIIRVFGNYQLSHQVIITDVTLDEKSPLRDVLPLPPGQVIQDENFYRTCFK